MRGFLWCVVAVSLSAWAQTSTPDLVQVSPPTVRRAEPPSPNASAEELEKRGDELRGQKSYLDALDYYRAALAKNPNNAPVYNKAGIAELLLQRYKEAGKDFERAIRIDHQYADAVNNLGVARYEQRKFGQALKQYEKAIHMRPELASYYSNQGAAYFGKKQFEKSAEAYAKALALDPDILEHSSHTGVTAQLPSPNDRARFDYMVAKVWAKHKDPDRCLQYLRKALEEGYKGIDDVYKDPEFATVRTDARFTALMASRPPAIPQ